MSCRYNAMASQHGMQISNVVVVIDKPQANKIAIHISSIDPARSDFLRERENDSRVYR